MPQYYDKDPVTEFLHLLDLGYSPEVARARALNTPIPNGRQLEPLSMVYSPALRALTTASSRR